MLKKLRNMSFIERKAIVSSICLFYKRLKISKLFVKKQLDSLSDSSINSNNLYDFKTLSLFETILKLMDEDEVKVIKNDFIEEKQNWWENEWSKTTYYKKKHSAINNFIYLFYG